MPLSTATISFDIADQLGNDFDPRRTKIWVTTNVPGDTIIDTAGDKIRLGSGNVTPAADGTGSLTVWVPGAGSNPDSWQTTVHIDYPDRNAAGGRGKKSFGPFTITTSANLADLIAEMSVQPEYASSFLDLVQGYSDHGSIDGTLTLDPAIGTHVVDASGPLLITLDDAANGAIVTLLVVSGADDVTVDGVDATLTDGGFATFVRIRGAWVLAAAGGEAAPADTTPPSAPTALDATGGEGEVTFSFTPGTDGESSVTHRYEIYLTADGTAGTSTLVDTNPKTVTGLTAGAYTVRVFARNAAGLNSTVVTDTFTVTALPGWSLLASDDFTSTDGTKIKSRALPVGGISWGAGSDTAPEIQGNKMVWASPTEAAGVILPMVAAASADGVEVEFDCTLNAQVDSSLPFIDVSMPSTPNFHIAKGSGIEVTVKGFNAGSSFVTLAGPVTVGAGNTLAFRRVGDVLTVLEEGTTVLTLDLAGGYAPYIGAATPNTVTIGGEKFRTSSIDNVVARILT